MATYTKYEAELAQAQIEPPAPLTDIQRAQVIAALSAVPEEQLMAYGLRDAVVAAVTLVQELQRDEEEALVMILAMTI